MKGLETLDRGRDDIRLSNLAFRYLSLWWSLSFCYWNIIIEVDLADAQELECDCTHKPIALA